jgi:hypothetical protein
MLLILGIQTAITNTQYDPSSGTVPSSWLPPVVWLGVFLPPPFPAAEVSLDS